MIRLQLRERMVLWIEDDNLDWLNFVLEGKLESSF